MRKILLLFIGIIAMHTSWAQTATVIATTNGIAPIPAFTLGEPAMLVFMDTRLGKQGFARNLQFAPDITFSLKDANLWFSDLWVKYNFQPDSAKRITCTIGLDFPSYFGQSFMRVDSQNVNGAAIYFTGQLKAKYMFKDSNTLALDYWYSHATDKETGVRGSYFSLAYNYSRSFGKNRFSINTNPNLFALLFSDGTRGFAFSTDVSVKHKKSGIFLGAQALLPLNATNVTSAWNVSLGVTRKLW